MPFAEVVVDTPLISRTPLGVLEPASEDLFVAGHRLWDRTFHYSVPPHLERDVTPGQLVWVPFGARRLQGVILGLSDTAPVETTRPLEAILDLRPVLTAAQIALARWISTTYLAPLIECVRLMLPPGVAKRTREVIELAATSVPAELSPAQRRVIDLLRKHGSLRVEYVARKLGQVEARAAIDQLVRRGLVRRVNQLAPPRVRPRTEYVAILLADEAAVAAALPHLGRASSQANVLRWLASIDDPLPALSEVCQAVGCTEAPVRALARRGLVSITPRRTLVAPNWPRLKQELPDTSNPTSLAVLAFLRTHPEPIDIEEFRRQSGCSVGLLRRLEQRGLVNRLTEEPAVLLNITQQEAEATALVLQSAATHHDTLELLRHAGVPVEVSILQAETGITWTALRQLADACLIALDERDVWRDPLKGVAAVPEPPPCLTPDQEAVWRVIEASLEPVDAPTDPPVFLLHGVTGSGKTEIYLQAIQFLINRGQQAIVLVPEIALTPQTVRRFAGRFPGRVTVWHSQLTAGERYDAWRRAQAGLVDVVVGSRSAVFAPLPRLGLIVLDEEHEWSYKQERTPRYHAREVAIQYARLTGAAVILGSATPDVESYLRAEQGTYRLLYLPERVVGHLRQKDADVERLSAPLRPPVGSLPPVQVVDLREELRAGNRSIFSRALQAAMGRALAAGQQVILFLNRRGAATFVICRDCGYVLACRRCRLPFTYHSAEDDLVCHHCGQRMRTPRVCPKCKGSRIRFFGLGTQRVEAEVHKVFPTARVVRWDRDTAVSGLVHERMLDQFIRHEADVLIGTQMIAKGLDLPLVTVVGVVSADTGLHLPDFRATERTFQLLTQVAGRAGRSELGGQVIFQTYNPDHYAVQSASLHDYAAFYRREITYRQELNYPPFSRLVQLIYSSSSVARCQTEAERLKRLLEQKIARLGLPGLEIIGPAPPFLERVRGLYRRQLLVRGEDPRALVGDMALPVGWRIDVDPVSLL